MTGELDENQGAHLCTCMIDLGGDKLQIVAKDTHNPVSWPEILVLQTIHGEDSVFDVEPFALVPRSSPKEEKERLRLRYGTAVVESVYAGKSFHMEWYVPGWPMDPTKAKRRKADRPKAPPIRDPNAEAALDAS